MFITIAELAHGTSRADRRTREAGERVSEDPSVIRTGVLDVEAAAARQDGTLLRVITISNSVSTPCEP